MRAGRFNITIETGAEWTRIVQLYRPDTPIPAADVVPDTRVFYKGSPALVYSVDVANGTTTIQFGHGLWDDPRISVNSTANVVPAVVDPIINAEAMFTYYPSAVYVDPRDQVSVQIPITVEPDGSLATMLLTSDETAALAPMVGASSWDLYADTSRWSWQRILEGTLTIIKGDTR